MRAPLLGLAKSIYYFVLITSFDSIQQFDSEQLRIKLWAGRGYCSIYATGICAAKKNEVSH